MNKFLLGIGAALILALSACGGGGGGGGGAGSTANTINGVANLGVVINGVVTAFKLTKGVKGVQLGAPATTTANGSFSIDVGAYTGPVVLELGNPNSNATFLDEATGNQASLPTAAAASTISSVLPSVTTNQPAAITPLTDIVATAAMKSAQNGAADSTAIIAASTLVANAFGLNGMDILQTLPANLGVSAGTGNAAQYASVLAGIANVAAVNTVTATVNNAATPSEKLIAQSKAYAAAMFNAKTGAPQAPSALTTGDSFIALQNAVTAFKNAPSGTMKVPAVVAKPTGATYAGNTYSYVYQEYRDADANVDYMERGTLTLDAMASGTPLEAWDRSAAALANNGTVPTVNLLAPFKEALTVNQNGSWLMPNAGIGGNISADGLVFAGMGIKSGAKSNNIVFGVKKPAVNPVKADFAGKVYNFTSQGSTLNNGGFVETIQAIGFVRFSADGSTLTYGAAETVNGIAHAQLVSNGLPYTITAGGLLKIVEPAINMTVYIAPSEGLKYAVWSEANYMNGRQLKSVGFAIERSNKVPSVANTAYNYFVSYWTSGGLTTAANITGVAGPQMEGGLLSFNANQAGILAPQAYSMQQVIAPSITKACSRTIPRLVACTGTTIAFTFKGQANGAATLGDANQTFAGFVSADGNVASFPGAVLIKR